MQKNCKNRQVLEALASDETPAMLSILTYIAILVTIKSQFQSEKFYM